MPAPRDLHPLLIALAEAFARRAGYDPDDVWRWLAREAVPPPSFVAGAVEAFYPLVRPDDFGALSSHPIGATVSTEMQAETIATGRPGRPPLNHRFTRALHAASLTVTEWAARHGLSRATVKGWYATGAAARPIPRKWADVIAAEYPDVPATRRTWRNGILE